MRHTISEDQTILALLSHLHLLQGCTLLWPILHHRLRFLILLGIGYLGEFLDRGYSLLWTLLYADTGQGGLGDLEGLVEHLSEETVYVLPRGGTGAEGEESVLGVLQHRMVESVALDLLEVQQVHLVGHQDHPDLALVFLLLEQLFQNAGRPVEGGLGGAVIEHHNHLGTVQVGGQHGGLQGGTGDVPEVDHHPQLLVHLSLLQMHLEAGGHTVLVGEVVLAVPVHQLALPHPSVPQETYFHSLELHR